MILSLDGASGAILSEVALGRDGWSLTVDDNNIVYVSGNGGGQVVDRLGPASVAALTVSLSNPSGFPVTVDFSTADGTALAGADYNATGGTLTFAPGETTKTILVHTIDDANAETNETFVVNLSGASGAIIQDAQGEATITETDAGVTVTATSSLSTSEAGDGATFSVVLDTQPTGPVTIRVQTGDPSEGLVSTSHEPQSSTDELFLYYTSSNWYQPQEVVVMGVDDYDLDGDVSYEIIITIDYAYDPWYSFYDPPDLVLTNRDDDYSSGPGPQEASDTKFFVVDSGVDQTFEYQADGTFLNDDTWDLHAGNTSPKGAASITDGSRVWVVDDNRSVYVYRNDGALLSSWTAGGLLQAEGIATDGTRCPDFRSASSTSTSNTTTPQRGATRKSTSLSASPLQQHRHRDHDRWCVDLDRQ